MGGGGIDHVEVRMLVLVALDGNLDNGWMMFPRGRKEGMNRAGPRSEMELWKEEEIAFRWTDGGDAGRFRA